MSRPPLPTVGSSRGAPMGRCDHAHPASTAKVYVHRLRLVDHCYDQGGAYWGMGLPLFRAVSADSEFVCYFRARNREDAIQQLRGWFPELTFYRS